MYAGGNHQRKDVYNFVDFMEREHVLNHFPMFRISLIRKVSLRIGNTTTRRRKRKRRNQTKTLTKLLPRLINLLPR